MFCKKSNKEVPKTEEETPEISKDQLLLNELFLTCVYYGSVEMAELMLEKGADINYIRKIPIDLYIRGSLLNESTDGSYSDPPCKYNCALEIALDQNNSEMVELLLKRKVNRKISYLNDQDIVEMKFRNIDPLIKMHDVIEKYRESRID